MRHRAHDHLFAAAGVTAALSLIGTGMTVLNGSVLKFDAWPLVAGDQPRTVDLPVAPVVAQPAAVALAQRSVFGAGGPDAAGLLTGGVPTSLSAAIAAGATAAPVAQGGAGVGSLSFSVPAGHSVRPDIVVRGTVGATLKLDGTAGSLGNAGTNSSDGLATPVITSPGATGTTRTSLDVDGDDVPDTWQTDHGTPAAAAETVSSTGTQARDTASAFRADPPVVEAPAPVTEEPAPSEPPATDETTPAPVAEPAPTEPDVPSTDAPAPSTDPAPSDPAPPAESAPSTEPAPPTDDSSAPATEPAPADAAPPADPAPAPAPADDPAPAADPAPADPAPAATSEPAPAPAPEPAPASEPAAAAAPAAG
jgi:hypothetical protein